MLVKTHEYVDVCNTCGEPYCRVDGVKSKVERILKVEHNPKSLEDWNSRVEELRAFIHASTQAAGIESAKNGIEQGFLTVNKEFPEYLQFLKTRLSELNARTRKKF